MRFEQSGANDLLKSSLSEGNDPPKGSLLEGNDLPKGRPIRRK